MHISISGSESASAPMLISIIQVLLSIQIEKLLVKNRKMTTKSSA